MEDLKFSVITVSYNQGEFIKDTIESVLEQNYKNFEHIVVDAGSTDNTLEILKSYPHLYWTSEPDRGQSHGLDKGFARATGDVIAWLNSDDWYAPNIFHEVADALHDYPVVMAPSAETNKEGTVQFVNPNVTRSRFQQLKYWVYFSWMIQPSIFFKRSVLDEVRRANGEVLDESLYYTMDYDLWMRIAERYPFTNRIETLCSYYRHYDENKTGKEAEAVQWENSRVFRRYSKQIAAPERSSSVIVPFQVASDALNDTLQNLCHQMIQDIEVVLVGYGSQTNARAMRKFAIQVREQYRMFQIKGVYADSENFLDALNVGADAASGEYLTFLTEGSQLQPDYLLHAFNVLANDGTGFIIPSENGVDVASKFGHETQGVRVVTPGKIVSASHISPLLTVKKVSFMDLGGFRSTHSEAIAVRELLLRSILHCWYVVCDSPLLFNAPESCPGDLQEKEIQDVFNLYILARTILAIDDEYKADPYLTYVHSEHRQSFSFPAETVQAAKMLLQRAPEGWDRFNYLTNAKHLREVIAENSGFSPAYYYLKKLHPEDKSLNEAYKQYRGEESAILS